MLSRQTLTVVWVASALVAIAILFSYRVTGPPGDEAVWMIPQELWQLALPRVLAMYGLFIGPVLLAWYVRPFPPAASDGAHRFRFGLALVLTLTFNGIVLFLLAQQHLRSPVEGSILDDVDRAVAFSKYAAFFVLAPNAYYFGAKLPAAAA
jgi:hypothetical protein